MLDRNRRRGMRVAFSAMLTQALFATGGCSESSGAAPSKEMDSGHVPSPFQQDASTSMDASLRPPDSGPSEDSSAKLADAATTVDASAPTCPLYQSFCDGACIPTATDPANCGGCGIKCADAEACSAGECAATCLPGLIICDQRCVDLKSDSEHCGGCNAPCDPGKGCVAGKCVAVVPLEPAPEKCAGGGPPISIGPNATQCLGNLAQTTFRWSLCSCTDLDVSAPLTADAYDSTKGAYKPGEVGGGIGVDRDVAHWTQAVNVGGTLWVGGANSYQSSGPASAVRGDLHLAGSWKASSTFTVDGDAYVVGTLHGITVKGATTTVESVPAPCDCAPNQLVPVADIVAAHRAPNNDNEAIGLDPKVLSNPPAPTRLDLPCGNYYLSQIQTGNALTIAAHGRTAIYIDGDVSLSAPVAFVLDPTAELDIFIAGTIKSSQNLVIGSPNYPVLSRTYVGGTAKLSFSQDVRIGGEFYAANSTLVDWSAHQEIYGSVFAGNFKASQVTKIHYDRGVLQAGTLCPGPDAGNDSGTAGDAGDGGATCTSCNDCLNQACIDGKCGACNVDSDCCSPLVCNRGVCEPFVLF